MNDDRHLAQAQQSRSLSAEVGCPGLSATACLGNQAGSGSTRRASNGDAFLQRPAAGS